MSDAEPPVLCPLVREGGATVCPAGLAVPPGSVLTRSVLRSVAVLVLLLMAVTGINLWWTAREVRDVNQSRCAVVQEAAR